MQTNHATRPTWATKGRNFRAAADDIPAERNRPAQASSSSGAVLPIFWCYAVAWTRGRPGLVLRLRSHASIEARSRKGPAAVSTDRKSTRLNSSHVSISYAVFCLKQKMRSEEHR